MCTLLSAIRNQILRFSRVNDESSPSNQTGVPFIELLYNMGEGGGLYTEVCFLQNKKGFCIKMTTLHASHIDEEAVS